MMVNLYFILDLKIVKVWKGDSTSGYKEEMNLKLEDSIVDVR